MPPSAPARAAITGFGLVTPVGLDTASSWEAALAGRSGSAPITLFDTEGLAFSWGCEVKDLDAEAVVGDKEAAAPTGCRSWA